MATSRSLSESVEYWFNKISRVNIHRFRKVFLSRLCFTHWKRESLVLLSSSFSIVVSINVGFQWSSRWIRARRTLLHWMISRQCIWHHYNVIYSDGILYNHETFSLRPGKNQHVQNWLFFFVISVRRNNLSHSTVGICIVSADVIDWNKWKKRELCKEQLK